MAPLKIATWNVNSIKARLPNVLDWLKTFEPDVALLQELKCLDENFPRLEIEDAGYQVETHGQKSYNGVAILSKSNIEYVVRGLPPEKGSADDDDQARYIEATVFDQVRVAAIYLPNGNPIGTEKFDYKIKWMRRLRAHAKALLAEWESPVILGGDYNVCETDADCYDPEKLADDALLQPESRSEFRALQYLGFTNAFRALNPGAHKYSYWDYQGGAWQKDHGIRIDHHLLSAEAADALKGVTIHRKARAMAKPSDHVPITIELAD